MDLHLPSDISLEAPQDGEERTPLSNQVVFFHAHPEFTLMNEIAAEAVKAEWPKFQDPRHREIIRIGVSRNMCWECATYRDLMNRHSKSVIFMPLTRAPNWVERGWLAPHKDTLAARVLQDFESIAMEKMGPVYKMMLGWQQKVQKWVEEEEAKGVTDPLELIRREIGGVESDERQKAYVDGEEIDIISEHDGESDYDSEDEESRDGRKEWEDIPKYIRFLMGGSQLHPHHWREKHTNLRCICPIRPICAIGRTWSI